MKEEFLVIFLIVYTTLLLFGPGQKIFESLDQDCYLAFIFHIDIPFPFIAFIQNIFYEKTSFSNSREIIISGMKLF